MYVGLGVLLLVVGAVLAFATTASVSGVDLTVVGWILMAGGLVAIVLSLALSRRRGVVTRRVVQRDPVTGTEVHDARVEPE
jgi:Zn-dependent protease with chaperone function